MPIEELINRALTTLPTELANREIALVSKLTPEKLEWKSSRHKRGDYNSLLELAAAAERHRQNGKAWRADWIGPKIESFLSLYGWTNIHILRAYFHVLRREVRASNSAKFSLLTLGFLRHAILALLGFPEVPLSVLDALADDLELVLREGDGSVRDAYLVRLKLSYARADESRARFWFERWRETQSTIVGPGLCEQDQELQEMQFELRGPNKDKVLNIGRLILRNRFSHVGPCFDIRERAAVAVLSASLDFHCMDDARAAYEHLTAHLRERRIPSEIAQLIRFNFVQRRMGRAKSLLSNYLSLAMRSHSSEEQFQFFFATAPVLNELISGGLEYLRVPSNFQVLPGSNLEIKEEKVALKPLQYYCLNELRSIAQRFDNRNQNSAYSNVLRKAAL